MNFCKQLQASEPLYLLNSVGYRCYFSFAFVFVSGRSVYPFRRRSLSSYLSVISKLCFAKIAASLSFNKHHQVYKINTSTKRWMYLYCILVTIFHANGSTVYLEPGTYLYIMLVYTYAHCFVARSVFRRFIRLTTWGSVVWQPFKVQI